MAAKTARAVGRAPVAAPDLVQIRKTFENGDSDLGWATPVREIGRPKPQKSKK